MRAESSVPHRSRTIPETCASRSVDGAFCAAHTWRAWHPPQRGQRPHAPPVPPLSTPVEPSAQESHANPCGGLRSISRGYPPSQRSCSTSLGPVQRVYGWHRPRYPAQQGHVRARRRCLRHLRGLVQQGHVRDGGPGRSWTAASPISLRLSHGHVLPSPCPQCCSQEARRLNLSASTSTPTWCNTTSTASVVTST